MYSERVRLPNVVSKRKIEKETKANKTKTKKNQALTREVIFLTIGSLHFIIRVSRHQLVKTQHYCQLQKP